MTQNNSLRCRKCYAPMEILNGVDNPVRIPQTMYEDGATYQGPEILTLRVRCTAGHEFLIMIDPSSPITYERWIPNNLESLDVTE